VQIELDIARLEVVIVYANNSV